MSSFHSSHYFFPGGSAAHSTIRWLGALFSALICIGGAAASGAGSGEAPDPRLDPRLRVLLQRGLEATVDGVGEGGDHAGESREGIHVLIRGMVDRGELESLGLAVGTQAGPVTTARTPLESIPDLLAVPGVERVEAANPVGLLLDVSSEETGATVCWGDTVSPYEPPYPGHAGAGVVIGIVDTGLDLGHPDFLDGSDQTRVRFVWDQTWGGSPPAEFPYGSEWTDEEINAGQSFEEDTDGHGTHLAGVAAGNGQATGNGYPDYRYVGMAPEADLVIVKAVLNEARVIDGVDYVFKKADILGKDAVVLLALGNHYGGHDGTSAFDEALSALTGPGRLVVAPAGNDGGRPVHSRVAIAIGETAVSVFNVPDYTPNAGITEFITVEGWYDEDAAFDVRLTSPNGIDTGWIEPLASSGVLDTPDGAILVDNGMVANSRGAKKVFVWVNETFGEPPAPGSWLLHVKRLTGTSSGIIDHWITGWSFASGGAPPEFVTEVDMSLLVTSPATGDEIISAGAYATKIDWDAENGHHYEYSGDPVLWDIAGFSSPGPRRDGLTRPDLAAPGYGVMAAMSADAEPYIGNFWKSDDGAHWIMKGTSVAAAHVAGSLALLLEQQPGLTPSEARDLLTSKARVDEYTGSVPNESWGFGKLCLSDPESSSAGREWTEGLGVVLSPWPNPATGETSFSFQLSPEELLRGAAPPLLRIFDVRGRQIAVLKGSVVETVQSLSWDGRTALGRPVAPGIYVAKLDLEKRELVWKVTRLP